MVLVLGNGKRLARSARRKSLYVTTRLRLGQFIRQLSAWQRATASWHNLATLNECYLKDLGLSRHDIPPDSSPPFRPW